MYLDCLFDYLFHPYVLSNALPPNTALFFILLPNTPIFNLIRCKKNTILTYLQKKGIIKTYKFMGKHGLCSSFLFSILQQ